MNLAWPNKEAGLWREELHLLHLKIFSVRTGCCGSTKARYGVKKHLFNVWFFGGDGEYDGCSYPVEKDLVNRENLVLNKSQKTVAGLQTQAEEG